MQIKIFTVYDSKAEAYLKPMFLQTKGLALRAFVAASNDTGHDFHKYAGDYGLWEIGSYDDSNATIKMLEHKINLGLASEHISRTDNSDQSSKNLTPAQNLQTQQKKEDTRGLKSLN